MSNLRKLVFTSLMIAILSTIPLLTAQAKTKPVYLKQTKNVLNITTGKNGKVVYGKKTLTVKAKKGYKIKSKSFSISKKKVASVSKRGVLTAKKAGSAKIKVTVKYIKKGKKKVLKQKLSATVTVCDKRKKTTNRVFDANNTKPNYAIDGLKAKGTSAPQRKDMKFVKTFNLGFKKVSTYEFTQDNSVTGDLYLMGSDDYNNYYCMFIKSNKAGAQLYSKKDYESSLVKLVYNEYQKDYLNKKTKCPSLSCIVFENEMKVYDGEDLFRFILGNGYSDLPRSSQLKYYGIYGIEKIDFSNVKSFRAMFADSFKVSGPMNIYLPECFKITNADTLNYMFAYSGYPEYKVTLTLPDSFDTSKVRNFRNMFAGTNITTLNLPPKFVFTQNQNSTKTEVDGFFYASNFKTINNATPFNTTNVTGCMCIPENATLKTHKKYIDELDFTNVDGIGLILYGVSDSETINYVLAKVEKEAKNNPSLYMTCCHIKTDQLVFGFTNNTNTNLSGLFDSAKIGSVTIKPRTISDASEMFENADVKTIDVSACTFTESCSFENMFRSWMGGIPTIYVKDAATQKRFIDAFNADNDKLKITDKNVIIKK